MPFGTIPPPESDRVFGLPMGDGKRLLEAELKRVAIALGYPDVKIEVWWNAER